MTQAATLSVSFALPLAAGAFPQPPWPPPPGISVQYEDDVSSPRIVFGLDTGSITLGGFDQLPTAGAQLLLITLDATDDTGLPITAPVCFNLSGTTSGTIWLGGEVGGVWFGGQFSIAAPGTARGVTGLEIVTTAPCVVRVQCVG